MKCLVLFVFSTLLITFGSFTFAQENQDTLSQPSMRQQKNGVSGQSQGQYIKKKNMMNQGTMGQGNMMDCSGCMVNRILMVSSNFYLDMRKSLGLTDAQVDELQNIRLNHTKETVDLQGELDVARLELQDMLESDDIQINDVDQIISDTYDLEAELQTKKVESMIEARNVLTHSQREKVKSMSLRGIILQDSDGGREQRR